jgi:hypothetical protein
LQRAFWAQRFRSESGIVTAAFDGLRAVFHDVRKIRPYSVQIYPTTSSSFLYPATF